MADDLTTNTSSTVENDVVNESMDDNYQSLREAIYSKEENIDVSVESVSSDVNGPIHYLRSQTAANGQPGQKIEAQLSDEGLNKIMSFIKTHWDDSKALDAITLWEAAKNEPLTIDFDYEHTWQLKIEEGNHVTWTYPAVSGMYDIEGRSTWPYIPPAIDMLDNDLLKPGNTEWLNSQIDSGEIKITDEKSIAIKKMTREEIAEYTAKFPPQEGNLLLFHGMNVSNIPGMLRYGFFGRGPNRGSDMELQDPTLSSNPLGIPIQFATYHPTGNAALLVIECSPEEFLNQGGYEETVGIPAKPFVGKKERLRSVVPGSVLNQDPRYLSSQRIREVILIV